MASSCMKLTIQCDGHWNQRGGLGPHVSGKFKIIIMATLLLNNIKKTTETNSSWEP